MRLEVGVEAFMDEGWSVVGCAEPVVNPVGRAPEGRPPVGMGIMIEGRPLVDILVDEGRGVVGCAEVEGFVDEGCTVVIFLELEVRGRWRGILVITAGESAAEVVHTMVLTILETMAQGVGIVVEQGSVVVTATVPALTQTALVAIVVVMTAGAVAGAEAGHVQVALAGGEAMTCAGVVVTGFGMEVGKQVVTVVTPPGQLEQGIVSVTVASPTALVAIVVVMTAGAVAGAEAGHVQVALAGGEAMICAGVVVTGFGVEVGKQVVTVVTPPGQLEQGIVSVTVALAGDEAMVCAGVVVAGFGVEVGKQVVTVVTPPGQLEQGIVSVTVALDHKDCVVVIRTDWLTVTSWVVTAMGVGSALVVMGVVVGTAVDMLPTCRR